MRNLSRRQCISPGCPDLTSDGALCEKHRKDRTQQYDARRDGSAARGYDADYRLLRVLCFQRDGWRCVDCGFEPTIVADYRRFDLGEPPAARVFEELRDRFNIGERHLMRIIRSPSRSDRTCGWIWTTYGPAQQAPHVPVSSDAVRPSESSQAEIAAARQKIINPILTAKRWSRGKWVTESGVGKNCIYEYLDGKRNPGIKNRQAMADALGLKLEEPT